MDPVEPPCTSIQRAYLSAFERWLRAESQDGLELLAKNIALGWVLWEAGIESEAA